MPFKPHPTDPDMVVYVKPEYAFSPAYELPQATTDQLYFRDPAVEPPPKATSMLLLNAGGVCIIGTWTDDCIGWCPKPKIPQSLKEKINGQS